jgi:nucleotide-binding universal stress UspA family protein
VLVSRELDDIRRILVPFCGSVHDQAAVRLARRMAFAAGAQVTILRIRFRDAAAPDVDAFLSEIAGGPVTVVEQVDDGNKATELVVKAAADGYDLVVLGTSPLSPEQLLPRCNTSFLVVHHRERPAEARRRPRPLTEPPPGEVAASV